MQLLIILKNQNLASNVHFKDYNKINDYLVLFIIEFYLYYILYIINKNGHY